MSDREYEYRSSTVPPGAKELVIFMLRQFVGIGTDPSSICNTQTLTEQVLGRDRLGISVQPTPLFLGFAINTIVYGTATLRTLYSNTRFVRSG